MCSLSKTFSKMFNYGFFFWFFTSATFSSETWFYGFPYKKPFQALRSWFAFFPHQKPFQRWYTCMILWFSNIENFLKCQTWDSGFLVFHVKNNCKSKFGFIGSLYGKPFQRCQTLVFLFSKSNTIFQRC